MPGWSDASANLLDFKLSKKSGRRMMPNRNNVATLTNITNNATKSLIADDEACKIIVATVEREYRGAERPAQQT